MGDGSLKLYLYTGCFLESFTCLPIRILMFRPDSLGGYDCSILSVRHRLRLARRPTAHSYVLDL